MPSWCVYNFLFQSLIIFIIYFIQIISTNDSHHYHQVLKVDVGQDITMSCLFDEDKIEQVKIKLIEDRRNIASRFVYMNKKIKESDTQKIVDLLFSFQ
jgi:hypothetical protein